MLFGDTKIAYAKTSARASRLVAHISRYDVSPERMIGLASNPAVTCLGDPGCFPWRSRWNCADTRNLFLCRVLTATLS